MPAIRVIPSLQLRNSGLVKTVRFRDPAYVGDPVNTVRIFNEMEVDELLFLDIFATKNGTAPPFDLLEDIASECFMPFAYGGGVREIEEMSRLFALGVEKVAVNTKGVEDPAFLRRAADQFGSQSLIASIDVRRKMFGGYEVCTRSGTRRTGRDPVDVAQQLVENGAGELLVTSMDRDGTRTGYDTKLIRRLAAAVSVPLIASGGAGSIEHLREAVTDGGASAVAAGSLCVYQGANRGVLINYPTPQELESALLRDAA